MATQIFNKLLRTPVFTVRNNRNQKLFDKKAINRFNFHNNLYLCKVSQTSKAPTGNNTISIHTCANFNKQNKYKFLTVIYVLGYRTETSRHNCPF